MKKMTSLRNPFQDCSGSKSKMRENSSIIESLPVHFTNLNLTVYTQFTYTMGKNTICTLIYNTISLIQNENILKPVKQ